MERQVTKVLKNSPPINFLKTMLSIIFERIAARTGQINFAKTQNWRNIFNISFLLAKQQIKLFNS